MTVKTKLRTMMKGRKAAMMATNLSSLKGGKANRWSIRLRVGRAVVLYCWMRARSIDFWTWAKP